MNFSLEVKSFSDRRVRRILPHTMNRARLAWTGLSIAHIRESIIAAIEKRKTPVPEVGPTSHSARRRSFCN